MGEAVRMPGSGDDGHIPVPGTYNFRGVAGLPTRTGRIRPGRLFRSDGLHRLGEPGRARLTELGVGRVVDLRDEYETRMAPDDVDGLGLDVLHLPVFEGSGASALGPAADGADPTLDDLYRHILEDHAGVVAQAVRAVARADAGVVVHCTAGKDRTGVVVAVALDALGVDRDDIVADYAASAPRLSGEWLERMLGLATAHGVEVTPALRVIIGGSPPDAMEGLLRLLHERHGGAREYLLDSGLELDDLARLEESLVDAR